ncbi:MAG: hypothetical protein ACYDGR_07210 [Candidatus Dormibacteria bacterium]
MEPSVHALEAASLADDGGAHSKIAKEFAGPEGGRPDDRHWQVGRGVMTAFLVAGGTVAAGLALGQESAATFAMSVVAGGSWGAAAAFPPGYSPGRAPKGVAQAERFEVLGDPEVVDVLEALGEMVSDDPGSIGAGVERER